MMSNRKEEKPKKKVIVIGGGIAGLSAGIYSKKCGFEVIILESHNLAGGYCTSWRRKGYLFEGGMHWLSGSGKNEDMNKLWRYVGALNDNVTIHSPDVFMEYNHNGTPIRAYRDLEKMKDHLMEISPEDKNEIRKLCKSIAKMQKFVVPVIDVEGVMVTKRKHLPISLLFSARSGFRLVNSLNKMPTEKYVKRFKHEGIRDLLRAFTNDKLGILPFIFTMGAITRGDGGFPEGGSISFVQRMAKTFTNLGGKILYKTRVDRVLIKDGKAVGVQVGDQQMAADAVIVTVDTMAIDHLFNIPLKAKWIDDMKKNAKPKTCTFISIGIDADLRDYPKVYAFKLKTPIKLANRTYEFLKVNNFAADPTYAPVGKSAITIVLDGDSNTYNFWKKAKEANRYYEEKQLLANQVIIGLAMHVPELNGHFKVCDVATPLTYTRHCSSWRGAWKTEVVEKGKMRAFPPTVKGLAGVYFAGHRMRPPGGLAPALISARVAVQQLCKDAETVFIAEWS